MSALSAYEMSSPALRERARDMVADAAGHLQKCGYAERDGLEMTAPRPGTKATIRMTNAEGLVFLVTVEVYTSGA